MGNVEVKFKFDDCLGKNRGIIVSRKKSFYNGKEVIKMYILFRCRKEGIVYILFQLWERIQKGKKEEIRGGLDKLWWVFSVKLKRI